MAKKELGDELHEAAASFLKALKGLHRSYDVIPEDDLTAAAVANIEKAIDQAVTDGTLALESVDRAQDVLDEEREHAPPNTNDNPDDDDTGDIEIRWGAKYTASPRGDYWSPVTWVQGRPYVHSGRYDKDDAEAWAEKYAEEEADRWVGDWNVTITHQPSMSRVDGEWVDPGGLEFR